MRSGALRVAARDWGRFRDWSGFGEWGRFEHWAWLLAPSAANVGFAVRTSCAAIFSLMVAMWMELGSPQWAPLTVWVVATTSRGESISKSRWRLVGTITGCCVGVALIAAFPQQAALFFLALAVWTGTCCGLATFFDGFRSYGFLVAGFTTAIVATDGIPDPDGAFSVAMARGTYIILGIICEAVATGLFAPNLEKGARERLVQRLRDVSALTASTLGSWQRSTLTPEPGHRAESELLAAIMAAGTRIEFDVLEMGPAAGRAADHARAALAALLAGVVRIRAGTEWPAVERGLDAGRAHIAAIVSPVAHDRFRFASRSVRQGTEGVRNGLRSAAGIVVAWLLWEVTAWPSGVTFLSYVVLVYGLLATRETPALASGGFTRGALWCAAVSAVFVMLVVPAVTSPEVLALALMVPMVVGGLAARTPRLLNHAFSFNMFFPVLIGPSNMGRYDEVSFLNGTSAFLGAVFFASIMFRVVLTFRPDDHLRRTIIWARRSLRGVAQAGNRMSVQGWLLMHADSMVRTVRTSRHVPQALLFDSFVEHMAITTLGMCVIEVREAARDPHLSPLLARQLRVFLRLWMRDQARAVRLVPVLLRHLAGTGAERGDVVVALRGIERIMSGEA
ncbi:FUSC family protein [Acetobacter conturbans]|uniref:FUSC family protein n=1 Tax=Acetobacter conturbans TaxID=1737472 RepID=A0ABX0JUA9_9PROT|nr:FUSC family protein [Acetobacter conturbans]NHN87076.1 FUSC family protein [Acetobacter conturbans]